MKGKIMPNRQATHFAIALDRLGRRILTQLESAPDTIWHWRPSTPHYDSLLTLATRFLDESEYWVLIAIGGQCMPDEHLLETPASSTRATVLQRCERWLTEMYQVIGNLPDAIMDLFVMVPPTYRGRVGSGSVTVRECLLYILGRSGLFLGYVECLGQFFTEGERILQEAIV
jgi:hypothetical protein